MIHFEGYLSPYSWRYASAEMREIWSEVHKRQLWRKIWLVLAEVQSEYGLVGIEQLDDLKKHVADIDMRRALEIEADIHHDLMAELKVYAEQCPLGGSILHLGATSTDIEDNADVLRIRASLDLIQVKLQRLLHDLAGKIDEWAETPIIAFTHLQPAEPSTLGYGNALALTTAGLGTVTLSPPGGDYPAGSVVSLQAVASPGWYFVGWAGDLGGATNPMSVLMTRTVRVAATFSSVPQYDLGIEVAGGGRVRTSPSARRFAASSTVSLAAEAHPGWTFTGWEGDASGSIPLATVWMQGDRHLRARFEHVGAPVPGLWSSAAELATAPLQGEAWDQVWIACSTIPPRSHSVF